MNSNFKVTAIDHVEVFVPDRYKAAEWYKQNLGLEIIKDFEHWAVPKGPLMISPDNGTTKIALFEGDSRTENIRAGYYLVAFKVSGDGFLNFLDRLIEYPVFNKEGDQLSKDNFVDHGKAFSIYFTDPWGNNLEITTYDYHKIKEYKNSK